MRAQLTAFQHRLVWCVGTLVFSLLSCLLAPVASMAAIFDDGNDRALIADLRARSERILTDEQRAILLAADRYGNVGFCARSGGNAALIRVNGRAAIVTSAHLLIDPNTQKLKCSMAELRHASFMPNVSYYDEVRRSYPESFTHRRVALEMPDIRSVMEGRTGHFFTEYRASGPDGDVKFDLADDWIAFFLAEDITSDVMPDGNVRGAFEISEDRTRKIGTDSLYLIGVAPDVRNGMAVNHQKCPYYSEPMSSRDVKLLYSCDTVSGSSGSPLIVLDEEVPLLLGIHTGQMISAGVEPVALPKSNFDLNVGTPMPLWLAEERIDHPAFYPFHIQSLLAQAGCYTGALDNKWGPGSRGAVDRFATATGTTLPGREPTRELLSAVESILNDNVELCQ